MTLEWVARMRREKIDKAKRDAQRQNDFEERCRKLHVLQKTKKERENKLFMKRVVHEAHRIRKREEEDEEERKKKGKETCSTQ
jgi:hypothetical protein